MSEKSKNSSKPVVKFVADGIVKEFFYNFVTFGAEDIDVYIGEELLTANYSVAANEEGAGGKVIFAEPPAEGKVITIIRNLEIKRTSDFQESGAFRAKVINHELDYQVATLQQLDEKIGRTVIFPPYASGDTDANLPLPDAGKAIVWNEDGTRLINSDIAINTSFVDINTAVADARQSADSSQSEAEKSRVCAEASENSSEISRRWAIGTKEECGDGSAKFWAQDALNSAAQYNVPLVTLNSSELADNTIIPDWEDNKDYYVSMDSDLRFLFVMQEDDDGNPLPPDVRTKSFVKRFVIVTGAEVNTLTFEYTDATYLMMNNTIPAMMANSTYLCVMSLIPEPDPDPELPFYYNVLVSMAKYVEG